MSNGKREAAIARYKAAMGTDWCKTLLVEHLVGLNHNNVGLTLRRWHDLGLIERRPAGGGAYCKNRGYEWRWPTTSA